MSQVSPGCSSLSISRQQLQHYGNDYNTMKKLIQRYTALLERAEATTDRNEAIYLIRESTKLREEMMNMKEELVTASA